MRNRRSSIFLAVFGVLFLLCIAPFVEHTLAQTRTNNVLPQFDVVESMFHLVQNGSTLFDARIPSTQSLTANTSGSATNTLVNTGLQFAIAGNPQGTTVYKLSCDIWYTAGSGGGLTLGLNGPGTPTELTQQANIESAATTYNFFPSQGTSWAVKLGTATTTVTTIQYASLIANIQNSANNPGTLTVQYADVNTTATTVVLNGSQCTLQ